MKTSARLRVSASALALAIGIVGPCSVAYAQTATAPEAAPARARWRHLGQADGMVSAFVTDIARDSLGFMWFATYDGLYRYDGGALRRFSSRPFDTASLAYNSVEAMVVDGADLYAATFEAGIDRYDARAERFGRVRGGLGVGAPEILDGDLSALYRSADGSGDLLFSREPEGILYRLDPRSGELTDLSVAPDGSRFALPEVAVDIAVGPGGHIFVASPEGAYAFHPQGGLDAALTASLRREATAAGQCRALLITEERWLWIGTDGGLLRYDLDAGRYAEPELSLGGVRVNALASGSGGPNGSVWIGTQAGLYRHSPASGRVRAFRHAPSDPTSLRSDKILSVYVDGRVSSGWAPTGA